MLDNPNLTEEEKISRAAFMTEQMYTGGLNTFNGVNIADQVARTTHRVNFDTFYAVN